MLILLSEKGGATPLLPLYAPKVYTVTSLLFFPPFTIRDVQKKPREH